MKPGKLGKDTSAVELTNVSKNGFWLLVGDRKLFLPFDEFPWFREATVGQLLNVELLHAHHLYWPDLDVDLALESIDHPERYPLIKQSGTQPTAAAEREARQLSPVGITRR